MQMNVRTSAARPTRPLYQARQKTADVQEQLEVASAEPRLEPATIEA